MNLSQHTKYQADWPNLFLDISVLRILQSDWLRAFLILPNKKFWNHLLPSFNLYLHAKYHADWLNYSIALEIWLIYKSCNVTSENIFNYAKLKIYKPSILFFSLDKTNLRILQSDWLKAFWLFTWDLGRQKTNNMNFHWMPNSEKRSKFLKKFIFGHFKPILPILVNFFGNLGCQLLDFTIIYHNTENQEKLMSGYSGKLQTDKWTDRQTDRQVMS